MAFLLLFCNNHTFQKLLSESINCIFSPINNNYFAKFVINANNFIGKTARNVFWIFLSVWRIIISIITFNFFQNRFKISINLKWHSWWFEISFKFYWTIFKFTVCSSFIFKQVSLCSTKTLSPLKHCKQCLKNCFCVCLFFTFSFSVITHKSVKIWLMRLIFICYHQ